MGALQAEPTKQKVDYGRRGKGYTFGTYRPASGDGFTVPYEERSALNRPDFLTHIDAWLPAESQRW